MSETKPSGQRVVVVGAGAGGIALAARLAMAGLSVTVVEQNDFTGGRCSTIRTGRGFRFDQGPSLLLMPELFDETFRDLGFSRGVAGAGVELAKCEPNYDIHFADGARFRASTDTCAMRREVERVEGPAGWARYLAWLAEAGAHYRVSVDAVLHANFARGTVRDVALRPRFVLDALLRLHPLESAWARARRYFATERLRRVFTFATMYMGMSPFDAPATYSLLQYAELAEGIWYPRGGFHAVLDALVRRGEDLGVRYRLATRCTGVELGPDAKTVVRVRVAKAKAPAAGVKDDTSASSGGDEQPPPPLSGEKASQAGAGQGEGEGEEEETIPADVVVINADLVYAYNQLLPQNGPGAARWARQLRGREASCSSISFYWSLRQKVPRLGVHNIFLADEYRESFAAIFRDHEMPEVPSFYVHVPSRIDPAAAPAGCDAVIVLVPVGYMAHEDQRRASYWDERVAAARALVIRTIEERVGIMAGDAEAGTEAGTKAGPGSGKSGLAALIVEEQVNTPVQWESKFSLDRGSILGLSHSFFNVLGFRPGTRARGFRGAYFVGASTHPGTGVPVVLAGAKITAEQVLEDLGRRDADVPWLTNRQIAALGGAGELRRRLEQQEQNRARREAAGTAAYGDGPEGRGGVDLTSRRFRPELDLDEIEERKAGSILWYAFGAIAILLAWFWRVKGLSGLGL